MPETLTKTTPAPVLKVTSLHAFLSEALSDRDTIRHQEIRWATYPVAVLGEHHVAFQTLHAAYITERDGQPEIIELCALCGSIAQDRRSEDIRAQEQIATILQTLETAVVELGVELRPGQFTLDASPLLPTPQDVLRSLYPPLTTTEGTTYTPWTDGWAVGLRCERNDGTLTYLYLNPSGETDEGHASVLTYLGAAGDPSQDLPQTAYDPFASKLTIYTVRTENGDRDWHAESAQHASEQHNEAFAGEPGETIQGVFPAAATSSHTPPLPPIRIDSNAPEDAILTAMMRVAQRLSCGNPDSPYCDVIDALARVKGDRAAQPGAHPSRR